MKKIVWLALAAMLVTLPAVAQFGGVQGARSGTPSTEAPGPPVVPGAGTIFAEDFADITTLTGDGWFMDNNPDAVGLTDWFQGNPAVFPSHAGAPDAYIAANFNNTGGSVISNWLGTPVLDFSQFDTLTFWTRKNTASTFPDRLEVRLSTNGASTDVGTAPTDVGDFTTLLIEINPTLTVGGYPDAYTQFTINRADLPTTSGSGRIAFRYWVTNAGPFGSNSDFIGIDTVEYVEGMFGGGLPIPAASTAGLILLALLIAVAAAAILRRS